MMKLRWAAASPFVRKIQLVAHELGLSDRIELVPTDTWGQDEARGDNPLGKIPCLMLDDGSVLFDSPVIAEYLDSIHTGPKLHPDVGPARWATLRLQALGDGICDAAVARRVESNRPDGEKSPSSMNRHKKAVDTTLDWLENNASQLAGPLTVGHLAVGSALGYLDLRFAHEDWRPGRHKLKAWFDDFAQRPSMLQTKP